METPNDLNPEDIAKEEAIESKDEEKKEMDENGDGKITVDDVKAFLDELSGELSAKDFDEIRDYISKLESKDAADIEDEEGDSKKDLPNIDDAEGDFYPGLF